MSAALNWAGRSLVGDEAVLRKEGHRLILEPIRTGKLLSVFRALGPLNEDYPDIDDALPPLDEPEL